jgi:hypothetical protein
MLTPKQAESAADALAMRPEAKRTDLLACPACDCACITPAARRHIGVFRRTPCPQCGALLRLKLGRAWLAAYLLTLVLVCLGGYLAWPGDRRFVQSFAGPFWVLMFVTWSALLRRVPLTSE